VTIQDSQGRTILHQIATSIEVFIAESGLGEGPIVYIAEEKNLLAFSLGRQPGLIATFKGEFGYWLEDGCGDGFIHPVTFDKDINDDANVSDIYEGGLVLPEIALTLKNRKFVDFTAACKPRINEEIDHLRKRINRRAVESFRSGKTKDEFPNETKAQVLKLAFLYLYRGDELRAKQIVQTMLPKNQQTRIWNWMQQKKNKGYTTTLAG
jgi:hypothetical protein